MSTDISNYAATITTSGLTTGTAAAVNTLITAVEGAPPIAVKALLQLLAEFSSKATFYGL